MRGHSRVQGLYVFVALCAIGMGTAQAEGLDAERFAPSVGTEASFQHEHPMVPNHLGWGLGLFFDFADDPVVERDTASDEIVSRPLDSAASADLVASIGFFGWSELGVHLPVQLVYSGDDYSTAGSTLAASGGLGDLRLVPKVLLLRTGTAASHFLLGAALPVSIPTGNDEALRGSGGMGVEPRLLAAFHTGAVGLGATVGYRWRSERPSALPWGDELAISLMASYAIVPESLSLQAEIFGGKQLRTEVDGADFPLEALAGLIYGVSDSLDLHGGAGLGLTDGIGDPDFRAVVGVRFRRGVPSKQHGFADSDEDGLLDKDDDCPSDVEDLDAFEDEDGCPEPDNDYDGILDDDDECPDLPEEAGGDGDGCPSRTHVEIIDGEMHIFGKVQFKTASEELDARSEPLLDQIAAAMRANTQVKRVRIEGHTDDVGGDDVNLRLSKSRAVSVKRALVARGIAENRLETQGLGESQPIAPNGTGAGRAKNRRVEFIIVEQN